MTTGTLTLRSLDIPAMHKFGIGFDSMLDELLRITAAQNNTNYPPYNIIKFTEDKFAIELAIAGFSEGEIDIELEGHTLSISGSKIRDLDNPKEYLHQGISSRNFHREFTLADHVKVKDASNENGILTIHLERLIPEEMKPKKIAIKYTK
jgi:molecular chaperone IbpA